MMQLVMRNGGAEAVQQAKDGREGLEAVVSAHEAGRPFDLVITDIQVRVWPGQASVDIPSTASYRSPSTSPREWSG